MQRFSLRRAMTALIGTLLLFIVAACGDSPALSGIITDAYTQKPVANATIKVGEQTVTTDANGKWTINTWKNTDSVLVEATDYATNTLALTDKKSADGKAPVEVALTIRPNIVTGKLLDEYTKQPIAGAKVVAGSLEATTAADGSYKLVGVPETYQIAVEAPDYTSASEQLERKTSFDATLRPTILSGVLLDKYSQKPISGITVKSGDSTATTDADGRYTLRDVAPDQEIIFVSTDYTTQTLKTPASTTLDITLRPSTVRGTAIDADTGKPLSKGTIIAMLKPFDGADETRPFTGTAVTMTRVLTDGTYTLTDVPENAQIQLLSPGYKKAWTSLSEGNFTADLKAEPFVVKAIYITASAASSKKWVSDLFDLVDRTELNAVVVDIKLDIAGNVGGVGFMSKSPLVIEAGTAEDYIDMEWLVEEAHKRDIYLIARMAVMRDNRLVEAQPTWAAQSKITGEPWEDDGGLKWLDPFNPNVTEYNVTLAQEIASYGFDEIQFDYIRFPSDGSTSNLVFSQPIDPKNNPKVMYNAIGDVLKRAHKDINGAGSFFSIDVFGYATWRNMWEIGQSLEVMADHTDYVCAMVYPSHYDRNELGFDNADAHPYEIVNDSIIKGQKRMEGKYAVQRPWLQAFTATWLNPVTNYGRAEVRAQMQAVYDVPGTYGWTLWNAASEYDDNWFDQ